MQLIDNVWTYIIKYNPGVKSRVLIYYSVIMYCIHAIYHFQDCQYKGPHSTDQEEQTQGTYQ